MCGLMLVEYFFLVLIVFLVCGDIMFFNGRIFVLCDFLNFGVIMIELNYLVVESWWFSFVKFFDLYLLFFLNGNRFCKYLL